MSDAENRSTEWFERNGAEFFASLGDSFGNMDWSRVGGKTEVWEENYLRFNFDGTSRYVLSTTESSPFRMKGGESGFANLYLAGDWTKSGIDLGCVEGAVTSAMLAVEEMTGLDLKVRVPYAD